MSKSHLLLLAPVLALTGAGLAAPAALAAGPAACRSGKPAVMVRVSGFKQASGKVKIGVYGAERYLKKKGTIVKQTLPVRSTGPVDVCLPVPAAGRYAIAIHHDLNGNGDKDGSDGAGYSGNPRLSITDLKPAFSRTAVQVGSAPRRVTVVLQYRRGLSVGPVNG